MYVYSLAAGGGPAVVLAGLAGRGVLAPVAGVLAPDGPNDATGGTSFWFSPFVMAVMYALEECQCQMLISTSHLTYLKKCLHEALEGVKWPVPCQFHSGVGETHRRCGTLHAS
jgi:hypothetical protein